MKKLVIAAEIVGIFGALVAELVMLAALGWARTVRGRYEVDITGNPLEGMTDGDERIN